MASFLRSNYVSEPSQTRSDRALGERPIDKLLELFERLKAHCATGLLAALEQHERGRRHDAVVNGHLCVEVDIDLHHVEFAGAGLLQLGKLRV